MYLFFLIFLIFISIFLNFLILLKPGKNVNDMMYSNTSNNIKLFNSFRNSSLSTNIIGCFACLFLIVSLILCNINDKKMNINFFENHNDNILNEKILNSKKNETLNTEIPH
ncbi:preprotein translocase subunit SecG [Buchnera aphidicola]|uniref:Preprotein translocase subunit SecG n=1 Tax=Buchnera aphidicola (Aphis nerii) TaxID=1241835 RepID=A0A4D6Y2Z4_9GAMM|nr:preprotein translocase subunit SecG [Buchnera aphidicola]QCI18915.1 preprotein translocase subunit SecG [Buchnera aphidicola (Aphis nerii)]